MGLSSTQPRSPCAGSLVWLYEVLVSLSRAAGGERRGVTAARPQLEPGGRVAGAGTGHGAREQGSRLGIHQAGATGFPLRNVLFQRPEGTPPLGRLLLCEDKQQQLSARSWEPVPCWWEREMVPRSVQGPQKREVVGA